MTPDKVRAYLNADPFRPFVLRLPSGKTVDVPHPDFAAISPQGRTLVVLHEDETESVVDVMLVEAIETRTAGA
jgi:hypothetical protein